jgi:hypothetical protein
MGIIAGTTTNFGIDMPEAYHKITKVTGSNGGEIKFEVQVFFNSAARTSGAEPLLTRVYHIDGSIASELSILTELYQYLKSLDEYTSASDVYDDDQQAQNLLGALSSTTYLRHGQILDGYAGSPGDEQINSTYVDCDLIVGDNIIRASLADSSLEHVVWAGNEILGCTVLSGNVVSARLKQRLI